MAGSEPEIHNDDLLLVLDACPKPGIASQHIAPYRD